MLFRSGTCTAARSRKPLGGVDLLPEDFAIPRNIVPPPVPGVARDAMQKTWSRPLGWETTLKLDAEVPLSVLQQLRKKKTYVAQQSRQAQIDAIDRMQTGFEFKADEAQQRAHHRQMYNDYLSVTRAERIEATKRRHVRGMDVEEFDLSLDLGLDAGSGLAPPFPELPRDRDPLWLQQPYAEGGDLKNAGRKLAVFDPMKMFPKKYKPAPETRDRKSVV